ncbi:MAG: acyltransferase [Deltaproteobacteria bacterium]|nr:MAG: acyltransferase [Deltaproteobacteria bacterium]
MKFTLRDIILSVMAVLITAALALFSLYLLSPFFMYLSVEYRGIVKILVFIIIIFFGLGSAYARILRLICPFEDSVFSSNDQSLRCLLWKQTVFTYEWTASIFAYITPVLLRPFLYRMLGAKLGKGVLIGGKIVEPQMVTMGDYSFAGEMSLLMAHAIMRDKVVLKKIVIGDHVSIGSHAVIMPGVRIGDESIVAAGALVPMDTVIPPGEVWGGIPAKKIKDIDASDIRS